MQEQAGNALSPVAQRRLSIIAASTIAAIAIVLALLISLRTPQYEAQARLAYSPSGFTGSTNNTVSPPGLASGTGSATVVADRVLSDAQLATLIAEYDLYPKLRQTKSSQELVERLRTRLKLTEPEPGVLQIVFRDADQQKTRAFTNGVAALLSSYELVTSVPAPLTPTPGKLKRRAREAMKQAVAKPVPASPAILSTAGGQDIAKLSHEVDRVDSTLADMASAKAELELQQRQVDAKIAGLEKTESREAAAEGRVGAQDGAHERTVLEQQIAVERAKLADLRNRYTEQYPDVQREESVISDLQARLARVRDTASVANPANPAPSPAMEKLRQERDRVQADLSRNADQTAIEQSRKSGLLLQMQQARLHPGALPPPAAAPAPVTQMETAPAETGPMMTIRVLPFRLLETAGSAGAVGVSRLALSVWLAIGTLVLVALCFAPLVPAHYTAVVESAEDLQQNVPEHVTYLGDVGRTEP